MNPAVPQTRNKAFPCTRVVATRTKPVEGVLRLTVACLEPRPAVGLLYDGLAGLSQRHMLRDLLEGLAQIEKVAPFLEALEKRGAGELQVEFTDYVSYGIGGGDATAEFFFGTYQILWVDATRHYEGATSVTPELVLVKPASTPGLYAPELIDRIVLGETPYV